MTPLNDLARPPTPDTPALDTKRLESYRDLKDEEGELLRDIIGLFVSQTPEWIAAATAAADEGDMSALQHIAHNLKGSCGAMGAVRMHACASAIELAVGGGDASTIRPSVEALTEEFKHVSALLAEYASGLRAP